MVHCNTVDPPVDDNTLDETPSFETVILANPGSCAEEMESVSEGKLIEEEEGLDSVEAVDIPQAVLDELSEAALDIISEAALDTIPKAALDIIPEESTEDKIEYVDSENERLLELSHVDANANLRATTKEEEINAVDTDGQDDGLKTDDDDDLLDGLSLSRKLSFRT